MNRSYTLDAGRFNRQLSIEAPVETDDGCGGFVTLYVAQGSVWAHLCPLKAATEVLADSNTVVITHRAFMRFRSDITAGVRLISGSRRFDVIATHDPDETHRYIRCDLEEKR